jgi:hypothetical protein
MANVFESTGVQVTSASYATIYTAPALTQTTLIGLSFANTYSNTITINVQVEKALGAGTFYLAYQAPIPTGSSLVVVGGDQKVVLEAGDLVKAQVVTTSGTADCFVSFLNIT